MGRGLTRRTSGALAALALGVGGLGLSGCGGNEEVTQDGAHRDVDAALGNLEKALTAGQEVATPWADASQQVADPTCGEQKARWRGVATVTLRSTSGVDNVTAQATSRLGRAGWDTQASLGADDGGILLAATRGGSSGVAADVVLTTGATGTSLTVALRSPCFSRT